MRDVTIGQVDYTVFVLISLTTGAPATGLTNTDIDIAYGRVETDNDVTTSDVTPASLSALTDAHSDWGFKEVSSGDHPGLYRLDIADAVFASGAWESMVTITDASGTDFYAVNLGFRLVGQDKTSSTVDSNVTKWLGTAAATPTVAGVPEVDITYVNGSSASAAGTVNANMVQISGHTGSADSLQAALDGTGGVTITADLAGTVSAVVAAMTLTSDERDDIADALLDLTDGVETDLTVRKLLRLLAALGGGKSSGGGAVYRDTGDTKDRITATVDDGNRTAITLDLT